jgi:flagellar protein FliS
MTYGTGVQAYTQTQVATTTNQQELIVMAYDGIIGFLTRAKAHMIAREIEPAHNTLVKARAVVEELASTLDMDKGGQIAQNLWNLYIFFWQKISEALLTKDPGIVDAILPSIQELRSAWAELEIPQDDAEARARNRCVPQATESHHRVSITG